MPVFEVYRNNGAEVNTTVHILEVHILFCGGARHTIFFNTLKLESKKDSNQRKFFACIKKSTASLSEPCNVLPKGVGREKHQL